MRDVLSQLAGKRGRGNPDPDHWHPLICHMLDVAAVALAMWDTTLGARSQRLICEGLGLDRAQAGTWVAFIAGCHDIGKCSRNFQGMLDGWEERLAATGMIGIEPPSGPRHGAVTTALLPEMLATTYGIEPGLARDLGMTTGGHHGQFESCLPEKARPNIGEGRLGSQQRPLWEAARQGLFEQLAAELQVEQPAPTRLTNRAAMALAGLISVADWVGSSEDFFPYQREGAADVAKYFDDAQSKAEEALKGLHWEDWKASEPGKPFRDLFDFAPNDLQRAMEERVPREAGLVIVEAPMGDGKTEAAFFQADRWNADGARGLYIALPTQATANQMYRRLKGLLRKLYRDDTANLVLAHSGAAFLEDEDVELLPTNIDGHDEEATVGAGQWFVQGNKRRLLAPYAVGTIDQSLLAALQVKHVFVRLFALAGKAVIFDEVHAYDAYMGTLLERLLEWLGALGSPVMLLSATLPKSRRESLMRAYLSGQQGTPQPGLGSKEWRAVPYPRVTWSDEQGIDAVSVKASRRSGRTLYLKGVEDDEAKVRDLLVEELADGGCAAVICNTVRRAQEMYEALAGAFAEDERGLFHARFVQGDRQRIEQDCLHRFGPPSDPDVRRPRKYVLVATQVIEQSLDLDFDVMVSDPAPIDLLLQRSGRLRRHEREGRHGDPELYIRSPAVTDGVPHFDAGTSRVYDEHILLRTWLSLRGRKAIVTPEDVEDLIEQVYGEGDPPDAATPALRTKWVTTQEKMANDRRTARREAQDRRLKSPDEHTLLAEYTPPGQLLEEDSKELHKQLRALTRLTEPSVGVILLPAHSDLMPDGSTAPSRERTRELLKYSITVSDWRAYDVLVADDQKPPKAFAASSALREYRLVQLDERGEAEVGGIVLHYDQSYGLSIIRPQT